MTLKTVTKVSALAFIAALTVGCASTSDVQKAQNDANEAKAMARQAMDAANETRSCCTANEDRLNRAFKKGAYK
ncbi:MAG: alanine-zipper protein [Candidatus Contendobacter sp.]